MSKKQKGRKKGEEDIQVERDATKYETLLEKERQEIQNILKKREDELAAVLQKLI